MSRSSSPNYDIKRSKRFKSMAYFNSIDEYNEFLSNEKKTFKAKYYKKSNSTLTREDFDFICTLGVGSFGKVILAKKKLRIHKYYAVKLLKKELIVQNNEIVHTLCEKRVLQSLNFSFTVNLRHFFMDYTYVYLVLPFLPGGELFYHFKNDGPFSESQTRFYAAQVLLGLEYLHNFDLAYRDLKPENILMDANGYLKLTDFGFCKIVTGRTYTLCGTPDYISPEIILSKGYNKAVDFWSFGVLIYELCSGNTPFLAPNLIILYEKIVAGKFICPKMFTNDLKDISMKLIQKDLTKRLGNLKNGIDDIKHHDWFKSIHWLNLLNGEIEAPFLPEVEEPNDTRNFDPYFTTAQNEISAELESDLYEQNFVSF